ncbi:plasmid mobilization protein [Empedobacter brevis]
MEEEINWEDYIRKEQLRTSRSENGKLGGRPKKESSDRKSKSIYIRLSEEEFLLLHKKVVASGQNQSQYCRNVLLNSSVAPIIQSVSRDQELQSFRTNFSRISNYMKFKDPLLNLEVIKVIEKMNRYLDDRNRENHEGKY